MTTKKLVDDDGFETVDNLGDLPEVVDDNGDAWNDADSPPAVVYSDNPDADDLMVPRLRLIQSSSREAKDELAKAGDWWVDGFDVVEPDDMVLVPISTAKTRVLFDEFPNSGVLCRSNDGRTGFGDPGGDCAVCPMSQWSGPRGERTSPRCIDQRSFILFAPRLEMLVQWDVKAWHDPAKFINTWANIHGYRNFAVKVSSFKGRSGAYYSKISMARDDDGNRATFDVPALAASS